jgi:hypothetical protein
MSLNRGHELDAFVRGWLVLFVKSSSGLWTCTECMRGQDRVYTLKMRYGGQKDDIGMMMKDVRGKVGMVGGNGT